MYRYFTRPNNNSKKNKTLQKERDLNPQPPALETEVLPIELPFQQNLIWNLKSHFIIYKNFIIEQPI